MSDFILCWLVNQCQHRLISEPVHNSPNFGCHSDRSHRANEQVECEQHQAEPDCYPAEILGATIVTVTKKDDTG